MTVPTASQQYLSSRGGSYGFSFEEAVLKGLASDHGLFIPEAIPALPADWATAWAGLSFQELAFEVLSLYISPSEIPSDDLRRLIAASYSTFRHEDITPLRELAPEENLHILELFHGPTFAFKDVALQFVGNLFEYFLDRKNASVASGEKRHALTIIGATSGDTGSAAIYGLRGKKDVSVFILHPHKRVSPIQEAQMTSVLDSNVHNLAVAGTFDDCQDIVKALFSHPELSTKYNLGAVNSINWARILVQIVYYFSSYLTLTKKLGTDPAAPPKVRYVVPTGNFGDILAGYFAKRMGLPLDKLTIATNANDILDRFISSGSYSKHPTDDGKVKETHSPAMDILASSNFERLLWYLALEVLGNTAPVAAEPSTEAKTIAGTTVALWMLDLKTKGKTSVPDTVLAAARRDFRSERVDDDDTIATIRSTFVDRGYVLDPHSAVGVCAAQRLIRQSKDANEEVHYISLSTAHPSKFIQAVDLALKDEAGYDFEKDVQPEEFRGLEQSEKRVTFVQRPDVELVREVVEEELEQEKMGLR